MSSRRCRLRWPARSSIESPIQKATSSSFSAMPPLQPRDSRLLWKRLRSPYPDLPIVVGFWTSSDKKDGLPSPENDVVSKVATTLAKRCHLYARWQYSASLSKNRLATTAAKTASGGVYPRCLYLQETVGKPGGSLPFHLFQY